MKGQCGVHRILSLDSRVAKLEVTWMTKVVAKNPRTGKTYLSTVMLINNYRCLSCVRFLGELGEGRGWFEADLKEGEVVVGRSAVC